MNLFGTLFGGGASSGGSAPTFPVLAIATTAEAIRDRAIAIIAALVPGPPRGGQNAFRPYRNEGDGNFLAWCEANPASAFRRFQVRHKGDEGAPAISNTDYSERAVTLTVIVAYPQTARTGPQQSLDRDDVAKRDQEQIDFAIGLEGGRANFSPPNADATWRSGSAQRVPGTSCDYLVLEQTMTYHRAAAR